LEQNGKLNFLKISKGLFGKKYPLGMLVDFTNPVSKKNQLCFLNGVLLSGIKSKERLTLKCFGRKMSFKPFSFK